MLTRKEVDLKSAESMAAEAELLSIIGKGLQIFPSSEHTAWFESLRNGFSDAGIDDPDIVEGHNLLTTWLNGPFSENADGAVRALAVECTGLMIGPSEPMAPPWGSMYLDRAALLFQASTRRVRRWYRMYGLDPAHLQQEPDDHIGLQISFLGVLSADIAAALSEGDQRRARSIRQDQVQFYGENLGRWKSGWVEKILTNTTSAYYRGLALMAQGTLNHLAPK